MVTDRDGLQARLRALFLDELADNIVVLNRGLVALEHDDGDGAAAGLIDEMFRAAHSLKGAAHSAGVETLVALCHRLEDVLGQLRDGSVPPSARVVAPLLEAVDALGTAGQRLREGGEARGPDVTAAVARLTQLSAGAPDSAPPMGRPPPDTAPVPAMASAIPEGAIEAPSAARGDGNVRVPAARLDALLDQAGEVLLACRRIDALTHDLVALADATTRRARRAARGRAGASSPAAAADWESWRDTADDLKALARDAVGASRALTSLGSALTHDVQRVRMTPLTTAFEGLERVVRDLARATGKELKLAVHAGEVEADRPIVEAVADALHHLVRNAIDHGIERPDERVAVGKPSTGQVTISAMLGRDGLVVTVADDGRGIDVDALRTAAQRRGVAAGDDEAAVAEVAFVPGLSTSAVITEVSGRGVGLDAVRARVERVGGAVRLDSAPGDGCAAVLSLPVALSAVRVLFVAAAGETMALASSGISEVLRLAEADVRTVGDREVAVIDGEAVAVLWLADLLGLPSGIRARSAPFAAVLVGSAASRALLVVDDLLGEEEIVMKPLGDERISMPGILGATILASGRVALVLSPMTCVRAGLGMRVPAVRRGADETEPTASPKRVLLAEDTLTTRVLERTILEAAGYDVLVAVDGLDAWQLLEEHGADVVVSDVDMPRLNGLGLCQAVRRSSRFANLPFVLVTSLASEDDRRRGIDAGANAYLVKADFDQVLLLDTLERLL